MTHRQIEIDRAVLSALSDDNFAAVTDLVRNGFRFGTAREALRRLCDAGRAERRWDGNARYGRFVYRKAA